MGLMAVGASAFYGFDGASKAEDLEESDKPDGRDVAAANANGTDTSGVTDLLYSEEPDVFPGGLIIADNEDGVAFTGSAQADYIEGDLGNDTLSGDGGEDLIYGHAGDDVLSGDDGADTLHGDEGDDSLLGGAGNDDMFGHDGADTLSGGDGDDSLVGSSGNDVLTGDAGNDALHGDIGDDTLTGGAGQDTLFGGWGDDVLDGSDDDDLDYLNGGGGNDLIIAGGKDIVTTGEGADTIALGDWITAGHQAEILDFTAGEDQLMIVYDDLAGEEPDVTLEQDEDDPARQHVVLNGVRIASVLNADGLTLADIVIVGQTVLAA